MPAKLLWSPTSPESTQMHKFKAKVSEKYGVELVEERNSRFILIDYAALHSWSITNIAEFWEEVWEWTDVKSSKKWDQVIDLSIPMSDIPAWFTGAKLNWSENMLRSRSADKIALIGAREPLVGLPLTYDKLSYADLYTQVHHTILSLTSLGLKPGQILGYYGPNCITAVVLLLATTAIGAIWSSAASDSGPTGVIERFEQFGKTLFAIVGVESVTYNGKVLNQRQKLKGVVDGIRELRASPESEDLRVILFDFVGNGFSALEEGDIKYEDILAEGKKLEESSENKDIDFYQADFDWPLWILFSSGTTGKPKPIVHRAGGMLLQSSKEHVLHGDLSSDDVFFYYSSTQWMMFNYLVSGLSTGCAVVLFDGSPLFRPSILWDMADDLGVTVFGTSAKYIDVLSKIYSPKQHHALTSLRQVLSTGSPLKAELFEWGYNNIKANILLASITGGTDICSLFGAHNASLPVFAGEIQCLGLGLDVQSWSEEGEEVPAGTPGDLMCVKPFPCMPVYFWNDPKGERYHTSYFEKFPGVWCHGDYCLITESVSGNGGGLMMLGRSDGVLNPSGIRFGSSEIYEVLDTFSPSADSNPSYGVILDSLVVGQKISGGSDERVVLFVKMDAGKDFNEVLLKEIKLRIRTSLSARHVPERILAVADIPHTINGKKVEIPIKKILGGAPLSGINLATLQNSECLEEYVKLGEMLRREVI